jgi:hypothetical protein
VRQHITALMHRQSLFHEGAELVSVRMLPGLKQFAHIQSDAAVVAEAV